MLLLRRQMIKRGPACAPVRPPRVRGAWSLSQAGARAGSPCVWVGRPALGPRVCVCALVLWLGAHGSPPLSLPVFSSL